MQFVRGAFILTLLAGLPALAICGDNESFTQLWSGWTQGQTTTHVSKVTEDTVEGTEEDGTNQAREMPAPAPFHTPAVYPKMKSVDAEEDTQKLVNAKGRPLRSAVYRPMAENVLPPIRRELASGAPAELAKRGSLEALAGKLRQMGARRYRMEERSGLYVVSCEFPGKLSNEELVTFEARSSSGEEALRDVVAQAQSWQRNQP